MKPAFWIFLAAACGSLVASSALLAGAPTNGAATEAPRYALVIGNARYAELPELPNVVNDLNDMCAALGRLQFKATCIKDIATKALFIESVEAFVAHVPAGANAVLYYAGHAVQVSGENYVIPSHASSKDPQGWLPQFVRLSEVFQITERARAALQFIVFDACRDDPEAAAADVSTRSMAGRAVLRSLVSSVRGGGRFASYGIAAIRDAPRNTLVLFATGAGSSALDGEGERNGPLTKHLLKQLEAQLHLDILVKKVIQAVGDDTEARYKQRQSPSVYGTFAGEFCFNGCPQVFTAQQLDAERLRAEAQIQGEKNRAAQAAQEERMRAERNRNRARRENVVVPSM